MGNNLIFPGKNDASINGGVAGAAKTITEPSLAALTTDLANLDFVVSGLACSYSTLNVTVATGEAVIGGRRCVRSGASFSSVALSASSTNYVWLQATLDGNNQATGLSVIKTTTSTPPSGGPSLLLATATTDGSGVTASTDERTYARDPWLEPIAWARLDMGTSTIAIRSNASHGVASVARNSTGNYTITLSNPIPGLTEVCAVCCPVTFASPPATPTTSRAYKATNTTLTLDVVNSGGTNVDLDADWDLLVMGKRTLNL